MAYIISLGFIVVASIVTLAICGGHVSWTVDVPSFLVMSITVWLCLHELMTSHAAQGRRGPFPHISGLLSLSGRKNEVNEYVLLLKESLHRIVDNVVQD